MVEMGVKCWSFSMNSGHIHLEGANVVTHQIAAGLMDGTIVPRECLALFSWIMEDDMTISTLDLLYAHGFMCSFVKGEQTGDIPEFEEIEEAIRLKDVINAFQTELKDHLVPDAKPFEVTSSTITIRKEKITVYVIEPVGGW